MFLSQRMVSLAVKCILFLRTPPGANLDQAASGAAYESIADYGMQLPV